MSTANVTLLENLSVLNSNEKVITTDEKLTSSNTFDKSSCIKMLDYLLF